DVIRTGPPLLLILLVLNLLDTAIRYSPQGIVVDVTLHARSFTVRDNGPGVAPEILTHIGERFYRPPGQSVTGSGLGLSFVRRIATLPGMTVSFGNAAEGGFAAVVSW
ncbi:two-component system sensor histidine kinase QseC, partial [Leptospira borgpetersenii serovar Hardjo-bovis]|nr:two-component system sensor histidine kinase QseC [Leptospira borgpetersenii serovar Hardjo-bovis]